MNKKYTTTTSFRLTEDTKNKLNVLVKIGVLGNNQTQTITNLINNSYSQLKTKGTNNE